MAPSFHRPHLHRCRRRNVSPYAAAVLSFVILCGQETTSSAQELHPHPQRSQKRLGGRRRIRKAVPAAVAPTATIDGDVDDEALRYWIDENSIPSIDDAPRRDMEETEGGVSEGNEDASSLSSIRHADSVPDGTMGVYSVAPRIIKRNGWNRGVSSESFHDKDPQDVGISENVASAAESESWSEIFFNDFENNNGIFLDGGRDAIRYVGSRFSHSGSASLQIRDNSGRYSSFYSKLIDVSAYSDLKVEFWFYPWSMEIGEDFFLEVRRDGQQWRKVRTWARGTSFVNNKWYSVAEEFSTQGSEKIKLRFRSDASNNKDRVYIDDVRLSGLISEPAASGSTSDSPTRLPTDAPTRTPTTAPTNAPPSIPTTATTPTEMPNTAPSSLPSTSVQPSSAPTGIPSMSISTSSTPSSSPSISDAPSSAPSLRTKITTAPTETVASTNSSTTHDQPPEGESGLCPPSLCRDGSTGSCLHDRELTCILPNNANDGGECPANHTPCSKLLFFDDFDTFDVSTWKHEITMAGGGNWEFQLYRNNRTNSYVDDGSLHLVPTLTDQWLPRLGHLNLNGLTEASQCSSAAFWGCERNQAPPISSARVSTVKSFAFKTGRLEVRARLPRGDWLWPAIWLLPKNEAYGTWPASGEIDVMESRGNAPGYGGDKGVDYVSSAVHWGVDWSQNRYEQTFASKKLGNGLDFSEDYHVFGLVRHSTGLYTYVDDDSNRILEVDWSDGRTFFEKGGWDSDHWTNPWEGSTSAGAPFDEEFFLIINMAVGGVIGYFPDGVGDKPWSDGSSNAQQEFWDNREMWRPSWMENDERFKIDWVKVSEEI